jgi:plastocyanin
LTPTATQVQPSLATPSPSSTASPATSLEPITLTVTAKGIKFLPGSLTIPAHVAVTLVMDNQDTGVLHDLGVNVVGGGRTETCKGPCKSSFVFAAHVPGPYHFFCSLHPEMVGDLRVTE